jgi:uncharacterized membrane protein
MPSASNEIVINRPVSEVFEFLSNPENDPMWRRDGRPIPADIEITDSQKDMLIEFQTTSGPIRSKGAYVFRDDGPNTRLQFLLEAELKGVKLLMAPMVKKALNAEVSSLSKLKRVLETF